MSIKPTMSKDDMKAMLKAQLLENQDMTIQEMMKSGLSRDICYKMRRKVRADIARKSISAGLSKEVVSGVLSDIKNTDMPVAKIAKNNGIGEASVSRIAASEGIDMKRRAKDNYRRRSRNISAKGKNVSEYIATSLSGDGLSLEWLGRSWGKLTGCQDRFYFGRV